MRETSRAQAAWADYLAMGEERSLAKLAANYHQSFPKRSPLAILRQLKTWSAEFGWQARLEAIAAQAVADAKAAEAERRRQILESGFALDHERVAVLKELTETLVAELRGDRLWLKDKKSIVTGQEPILNEDGTAVIGRASTYEVFDLEKPNQAWVQQVRGLLDDIAQETGGRVRKTQLTGKDDGPVEVEVKDTTPLDQRLADVGALIAGAFAATRARDPE